MLDSAGKFVCINQSTHLNHHNPTWEVVEVRGEQLGSATELKVEVWDHDMTGPNDLIGVATFPLPTMASLVHEAEAKVDLASQMLMRPQDDATDTRNGRGTVEGHFTFTLVERAAVDPQEELSEEGRVELRELFRQLDADGDGPCPRRSGHAA